MHGWKCHNQTLYTGILNKNVFFSLQKQDRNVIQVLSGGWYQWEGARYKERVWEGEYDGNMYSCMKMET
jgi:hypothetical protein